jgi:glycosyltransferase involved in cell wall biosynthesis
LPPPANVKLFYEVEDEVRNTLLGISDLAINPMTYGSGTSLKMFDFFAAGLPVISTALGARGIELENGREIIICAIEEFKEKINAILGDAERHSSLSMEARRLAEEEHDWEVIAEKITDTIKPMLQEK